MAHFNSRLIHIKLLETIKAAFIIWQASMIPNRQQSTWAMGYK